MDAARRSGGGARAEEHDYPFAVRERGRHPPGRHVEHDGPGVSELGARRRWEGRARTRGRRRTAPASWRPARRHHVIPLGPRASAGRATSGSRSRSAGPGSLRRSPPRSPPGRSPPRAEGVRGRGQTENAPTLLDRDVEVEGHASFEASAAHPGVVVAAPEPDAAGREPPLRARRGRRVGRSASSVSNASVSLAPQRRRPPPPPRMPPIPPPPSPPPPPLLRHDWD